MGHTTMHFYLLLTASAFTAMTAAQLHCNPATEYVKDDKCCKMCEKGTRMLPQSTCLDPVCVRCEGNEYMDTSTNSSRCKRQPYCDPNKNFQVPIHRIEERTICHCKEGFRCSTNADCITCVEHAKCEPGFGVKTKGNETTDTVCQQCPDGTFSSESSSDGVCQKWTVCMFRYEKSGTKTSDTTCVAKRGHVIAIIIVAVLVMGLVLAGLIYYIQKKKSGYMEIKAKVYACVGCQETERIAQAEQNSLVERSVPGGGRG